MFQVFKKLGTRLALSISACLGSTFLLAQTSPKAAPLIELIMDKQHIADCASDFPVSHADLDSTGQVWFIGKHSLWKWSPSQRTLQQIQLPHSGPLRHLLLRSERIFVSDDKQVFQIEKKPFKVISYPTYEASQSLSLLGEQSPIFWIKSDGIYGVDPEKHSLEKFFDHHLNATEDDHYLYLPSMKTLWMTRNEELVFISYGDNGKPKKYGKIEKNIQDIQPVHDEVFARSSNAIFRFNKRGGLIQTVPVNFQRRIVASSFQDYAHAFLFQDRLFEIHLPKDHSVHYFQLDVGYARKVSSLSFSNALISLVLDGKPHVFQFSNATWPSS